MDPSLLCSSVNLFGAISSGTKISILVIALVILILMSGFFSASETALSSANRIRLRNLETNGNKRAGKVLKMLSRYDKLISTILIGNNIVNITATTLGGILFGILIKNENLAPTIATIVLTAAILIFGEITPKTIAKERAEAFSMAVQPVMSFFIILLTPINAIFVVWKKLLDKVFKTKKESTITEDELITMVEEAHNEGQLEEHESQLIRSAIEFEDVDVKDIMVPRVKVIAVEDDETMEEIDAKFREHRFSRLPVYNDTIDTIIGILHEKDFNILYRDNIGDVKSIIQNSLCLSKNMKISAALRMMQKAKVQMAIVVDEFGGTAGIISMEDILEELVGEIWDEHDDVEVFYSKLNDTTYIFEGAENLEDMFDMLGMRISEEYESTTVGGWVTEMLKKIPEPGESFLFGGFNFEVTKASEKSVTEIKAVIVPQDQEEE